MDAQEEGKEKQDKQVQDRAAPADEVNSSKSKNSRKSTLAAIFIGLFDDNSHQHALFVNSCPNSERLPTVTRECYYQAFAIEIPPGYSSGEIKFIAGIPYTFQSNLDKFESEPTISLISSPINEITPLSPKNYHKISSAPIIRGSFSETRGRYCVLLITELPNVHFFSPPEILVFRDQVSGRPGYLLGNDVLLEPRTGFTIEGGRPFVCVGDFKTTVHRGNFTLEAIQDTPPIEFIAGIAAKMNAHLMIGCEDVPGCLTINNREIIAMGGLSRVTCFDEFMVVAVKIIKDKYGDISTAERPRDDAANRLALKATNFLEDFSIPKGKTTIIWGGRHEGLHQGNAISLCKILNEKNFSPRVMAVANGITLCAGIEATCEVNPSTFPAAIFDKVLRVSGTVAVSNPTLNGKKLSNRGSRNTVSYLMGVPRKETLNPWDNPPLFPETEELVVPEGTSSTLADYGSDDPHISPTSSVIIVPKKKSKALTDEFDKNTFTRTYELLRTNHLTSCTQWAFIHFQPHPLCDYQQLDKSLERSHVYRVSTSLLTKTTGESPAIGILKATGHNTYKQRTPAHMEYISTFRTSKKTKPIIFPLDDFHVKIIMDDADEFPGFIEFLKEANIKLGSTWFPTLRQGGVDHSLFTGNPDKNQRSHKKFSSSQRNRHPQEPSGHFILIEGMPIFFNADLISKQLGKWGIETKRAFWGKNKEMESRFIIETAVALSGEITQKLPKQIYGANVEFSFTNFLDDWEDAAGSNTLTSFKFLDDVAPKIMGNLGELIEMAKKKYQVSVPVVAEGAGDLPGSDNNSSSSSRPSSSVRRGESMGESRSSRRNYNNDGWQHVGGRRDSRHGYGSSHRNVGHNPSPRKDFKQKTDTSRGISASHPRPPSTSPPTSESEEPSNDDADMDLGVAPSPLNKVAKSGSEEKTKRRRNRKGSGGMLVPPHLHLLHLARLLFSVTLSTLWTRKKRLTKPKKTKSQEKNLKAKESKKRRF